MRGVRLTLSLVLVLALAAAARAGSPAPADTPVAFTHANVVPMDSDRVLRDQTVVVWGGRIAAIGPAAQTAVPAGARRVDVAGGYLMPGLADMHVHVYAPEELTLYALNGVTSVFNLNGRPAHLALRRRIASGELFGPTFYSVGPTFDHSRTPEEAVAEVDRISAQGWDGVKIYNQVSKAEYPALAAETKKKNLIFVGHVAREPGFEATLAAGQSIAHAEEYVYTFFNDDPDPSHEVVHALDTYKISKAVAMTKEAGISVIPTLVAFRNIVRQATAVKKYLEDPNLVYMMPTMRTALEPAHNTYANRFPPEKLPGLAVSYEFQRQLVKALHDGGVPILAGTDASWLGVPGFCLLEEVEIFQDLGFTPYAALKTATVDAAKLLRKEDEFGTLAPGKRADIIVTRQNPLEDVRRLRAPEGVMVRGRWIPAGERKAMLEAIPEAYRKGLKRMERQVESDPAALDAYLVENDPYGNIASGVLGAVAATRSPADMAGMLRKAAAGGKAPHLTAEEAVNQLGYDLLAAEKPDAAIEVFRLNTELYPKSGNTYDSLAETYLGMGKKDLAKECYSRALQVQPDYPNAKAAKEILEKKLQ
jgi:imidazolonepropionase-like amidohydrolase